MENTIEIQTWMEEVDVTAKDPNGQTLLHWAAAEGYADTVEVLLHYGADPQTRDRWGRTALDLALEKGQRQVVQVLRRG